MSDQLEAEIIDKIASYAEQGKGSVTRATRLADLGIHSLELTEIIFDFEDKYGIEVDINTSDAWETMETVGDIADAVRALVQARG
ncbi:acyl carrier protein [Aquibium sp. LZ166]|uniref:Acyl carrier protein n=1 Tax=Aquibium pacificus TaxID=3153579 RepID=A0ABV3SLU4_9HYPH